MSEHRFKVGDLVRVQVSVGRQPTETILDALGHSRPVGIHETIRLLPEMDNGEPQYRIRGCDGQPERVVRERELIAAASKPQPRR